MRRFDGTAARQLPLIDEARPPAVARPARVRPRLPLRMVQRDLFAELARRRRRAQIAARRALDQAD